MKLIYASIYVLFYLGIPLFIAVMLNINIFISLGTLLFFMAIINYFDNWIMKKRHRNFFL